MAYKTKEAAAAYKRKYYQTHKEEIAAYKRKYYQTHKEEAAIRGHKYYEAHKEKHFEQSKIRREKSRSIVQELKSVGCQRCGFNKCLDAIEFHHIDPTKKEISLSGAIRNKWARKRIEKEASKCMILCANCHRIIHEEQRKNGAVV